MASSPTRLMTFEEFAQLPDPIDGARYELHRGELVTVAPPKNRHFVIQQNTRDLIHPFAVASGRVFTEVACRPVQEHEYFVLDVAFLTNAQWDMFQKQDYFRGAPALAIEVLSPSNTLGIIAHKKRLCLANGSREFWVASDDRRTVEVSTAGGTTTYTAGQHIPLFFGGSIAVEEIFR